MQHQARRERVGFLRLQLGVAAEKAVILLRRVGADVPFLAGRHPCKRALRRGRGGRLSGGIGARISGSVQANGGCLEKLEYIGRPNRSLVAESSTNVLDGRPLGTNLV